MPEVIRAMTFESATAMASGTSRFSAADDILAFFPHTQGEAPKEEKTKLRLVRNLSGFPSDYGFVSAAGAWTPTRHPAGLPL